MFDIVTKQKRRLSSISFIAGVTWFNTSLFTIAITRLFIGHLHLFRFGLLFAPKQQKDITVIVSHWLRPQNPARRLADGWLFHERIYSVCSPSNRRQELHITRNIGFLFFFIPSITYLISIRVYWDIFFLVIAFVWVVPKVWQDSLIYNYCVDFISYFIMDASLYFILKNRF